MDDQPRSEALGLPVPIWIVKAAGKFLSEIEAEGVIAKSFACDIRNYKAIE
jgi:hypothetical protein